MSSINAMLVRCIIEGQSEILRCADGLISGKRPDGSEDWFIRGCILEARPGEDIFVIEDGVVKPHLHRYAIIPREDYEKCEWAKRVADLTRKYPALSAACDNLQIILKMCEAEEA